MSGPEPSAQAQPSEEATVNKALVALWHPCGHRSNPNAETACGPCSTDILWEFGRERERLALERASAKITETADSLHAWMLKLPLHSEERKDKSLRAGELYGAAEAILALAEESK